MRKSHCQRCRAIAWIFTAVFALPVFSQGDLDGWTVAGATKALSLIAVETDPEAATFVLKNTSGKPISAFSIEHDSITHGRDYFETDHDALAAGASWRLKIGNRELADAQHVLHISVLFTDGSAEGFPDVIDFLLGRRLGQADEAFRVAEVLGGNALSSAADID